MKGFLEHWTGTVSIGDVSWNASPASQKNASGVDTISTNATITATVDIINPDGYPLDGGIGSAADAIRSVRISGAAGAAALAKASVISSSSTSMEIEIAPLSMIPTQESLGLEHTNFTVEFAPTRSDNALQSSAHRSLTLRYNTPPRMPLEVVEDGGTLKFLDGNKQWGPVTGSQEPALNGYIFWAYPSGITDSTHPDCAASFRVTDGTHIEEQAASAYLMANNPALSSLIPKDLVDRGYELYCYSVSTPTVATKVEAVDNEGVRSHSTESGRTIYEIILDGNGGSFGSRDTVIVFRADGAALNGGDLDVPTRSGHYLSGWTMDGVPVTFPYTVSEPVTLTAQWTVGPAIDGGGSDEGDSDGDADAGGGSDGGASGEGDSDAGASGGGESDDGAGDIGVPSTYTVTFNAAGGKFADGKDSLAETVQGNNKVTEPTPPTRGGWVFTWWKDPATGSAYDFSKPVTSNLTLSANWTQEFYVSPSNGDDTNLGTQDKPLKNLQAAVDKIDGLNDGTSTYTILLVGDVDDSSSGSYDSGKNSALVNIVPTKTLSLIIKSDTDGNKRTINAGRTATSTGRVMYVGDKATVTLRDLVLTGGYSADFGGGIYCGGTLTLDGTTSIAGNEATNGGGGILVGQDGEVTIAANSTVAISGNEAANGGGVYVSSGGTFNANGGTIGGDSTQKNTAADGGGVYNVGTLNLAGATISHNEASNAGGGVYTGGTLIMESGDIANNVAQASRGDFGGGGVYVSSGTFTMNGGEVSQNNGTKSGGGVYVYSDGSSSGNSGTLSMNGGSISGNTATNGGGVYVSGGTLSMLAGEISNNAATDSGGGILVGQNGEVTIAANSTVIINGNNAPNGGGVSVSGGTLSMCGGEIYSNSATNGNGGGVYVATDSTFTASGGTIGGDSSKKNTATNGGGVYIAGAGTDTSITPGKLVLAGTTISYNESSTSGGGVANYGTLEMSSGSIAYNTAGHNGGGVNNAGTLTVTEGFIENNWATADGGGVYVAAKKTFTMENGSISSNTGVNGGGVYVQGSSTGPINTMTTFAMNGGTILNNEATENGGGIYVHQNGKADLRNNAQVSGNSGVQGGGVYVCMGQMTLLSMQGLASITDNQATSAGDGVYLEGVLGMMGGSISSNGTSSGSGTGVYVSNNASKFQMGGTAVVDANNAVDLSDGKFITITSSLTGTAPVATITPFDYTIGRQVLSAGSGVTLSHEAGKFALSSASSGVIIDNTGKLGSSTPVSSTEVLSKLQNSASCSDTFLLASNTTSSDLDSILKVLYTTYKDNNNYGITLDLSKTVLTEFSPSETPPPDTSGNAGYVGIGLAKIILPATIQTINSSEVGKTSPLANVSSDAFTVECIDPSVRWKVTQYRLDHDDSGVSSYTKVSETETSTIESYYLTYDGSTRYVLEAIRS